jgi:hypothetical protein
MAFQDLSNIPVNRVDTVIDVVSKGDGSHERDAVFVTSSLGLTGDIDTEQEATLILPLATEAQQNPIVRYTDEPIKGSAVFEFDEVERSVYDQAVVDKLEALADGASKKEQRDLAVAVGRAANSLSAAVITVKPGQRELRLFYEIAAGKVADREFQFDVIGPLPSFVIQTGGSIGVIAVLPRNTSVVSAAGYQDLTGQGTEIPGKVEADIGYRHLVGWSFQNDPLFRIHYRYA